MPLPLPAVTRRQLYVFLAVVAWGPKETASRLGITTRTADVHLERLYLRLDVHNREAAVWHLWPYIGSLFRIECDPDPAGFPAVWEAGLTPELVAAMDAGIRRRRGWL